MRREHDELMMSIAAEIGTRSTCSRLNVGALAVLERRILTTGYNGAPAGMNHCKHDGDDPCRWAVHAEANVVAFAAKHGVALAGATLYTTHSPCLTCAYLIINSGMIEVVFGEEYRDVAPLNLLERAGLKVWRYYP